MRGHSRFCWSLLLAGALVAFMSSTSHAYGVSGAGGKLGMTNPEDHDQTMMVGGHVELEQSGTRVHLMPNLMYWHVNRTSDVNPNFDAYYHFGAEGTVTPYLGAGLGLNMMNNSATDRSKTDLGANLLGGLRFPGGGNHYFVEGRYTASDVPQVAVLGGVTFHTR
jgi:hypothetical protein